MQRPIIPEYPHPNGSSVDLAAAAIVDGIAQGRYAPGQRLIEVDLTHELGISRSTLREAARRLAAEGLLDIEPHRGARVRRLTRRGVAELYCVRETLETLAADLAARRVAAGAPSQRLRLMLGRMEAIRGGNTMPLEAYMPENTRFHDAILELADNAVLARQIASLRLPSLRLQVRMMLTPGRIKTSASHHVRIAKAVLGGRPVQAAQAMRAHIHRSWAIVERLPAATFASDPPDRTPREKHRTKN